MSNKTFTWMHLSDIHFNQKTDIGWTDSLDRSLVALTNFFKNKDRDYLLPETIFVTGDIAFSGKKEEYDNATRFLDELSSILSIDKHSFFIVPGNHDITKTVVEERLKDMRSKDKNAKIKLLDSNDFENEGTLRDYLKPFENYNKWCRSYLKNNIFAVSPDHMYSFNRYLTKNELEIGVIGINTSLNSESRIVEEVSDIFTDQGRVRIGENITSEIEKKISSQLDPVDLVFTLGHHPINWSNNINEIKIIRKYSDFYLQGHIHIDEIVPILKGSVNNSNNGLAHTFEISAGSIRPGVAAGDYTHTVWIGNITIEENKKTRIKMIPLRFMRDGFEEGKVEEYDDSLTYTKSWVDLKNRFGSKSSTDRKERYEEIYLNELLDTSLTLKIKERDTHCSIFPVSVGSIADLKENIRFFDDFSDYYTERTSQILKLIYDDEIYLPDWVNSIFDRLNEYDIANMSTHNRINEGAQRYPRMVRMPAINDKNILTIKLGYSLFNLGYIVQQAIYENRLEEIIPEIRALSQNYQPISFAIKVMLIYEEKGKHYIVFQQRNNNNFMYKRAWDLSAAGYLEPQYISKSNDGNVCTRNKPPALSENILSAWCHIRKEIEEEIGINERDLPYIEGYNFLCVIRNNLTKSLDLIGYVESPFNYNIQKLNEIIRNRGVSKVEKIESCELNPQALAEFIKAKKYWEPKAIVSLILILLKYEYDSTEIENAFGDILEDIVFDPFYENKQ